jgi:uncharacterized membrane-anchored protein YitT (DUF2179 family)
MKNRPHLPIKLPPTTIWRTGQRLIMVLIGTLFVALGYSLFQVPFNLAAGGVGGLSIIINALTGLPAGVTYLLLNIPLLIIGFVSLGRWRFLGYTIVSVFVFSFAVDFFSFYLPGVLEEFPITDDMLLSAVYAGIISGIGNGFVYRAGGTMGGTNVIGRLIQRRTGIPLSQSYLYADGLIILLAGLVFGWEIALHAFLTLFIMGMASDFVLEGPSMVRNVTIITNYPEELTQALMVGLRQGASHWYITGSYTGKPRAMVMCTVYRSQVNDLKHIVANMDPDAFLVIGQSHQALGGGFLSLRKERDRD